MRKGAPELLTLASAVFLIFALVDSMPSKRIAFIVFVPLIIVVYIILKIAEQKGLLEIEDESEGHNETSEE